MDIGKIRMSLLNFAGNQINLQNQSISGVSQQQYLVTNSVNSHRPLHEQESIEREIRKNSRVGTGTGTSKQMTSPRLKPGVQMPILSTNIQKVFMLRDICLSQ